MTTTAFQPQTIQATFTGVVPLLMHNARELADPTCERAKRIAVLSKTKNRTPDQEEDLKREEWYGGLYTKGGRVIIPGANIHAAIIKAAKKERKGPTATAAVIVEDATLKYPGPKSVEELWASGDFIDRRPVKLNGRSTVMRTRPIFREWSIDVVVDIIPGEVEAASVIEWMRVAGLAIGLCDYKPQFGRFLVEVNE